MGYRTEGLEKMFAKLTERSSAVSGEHADLGQLDSLSTQKFQQAVEPSLTVYARVMGQEISFLHLDQVSIMDLVARGKHHLLRTIDQLYKTYFSIKNELLNMHIYISAIDQ